MDPKLYLVNVLYVFTLVHLSLSGSPFFGAYQNDYYMNIKTSVDFQLMHYEDNAKWRNDSLFEDGKVYRKLPCKVQLDHRDNCYLYLVKNQSTSSIHGPIRIDPKHIDLDIKFNVRNEVMNDPDHKWMDKSDLELHIMYYARCHLMHLIYKISGHYPIRSSGDSPLNTYLELDSKTASLFPKIEKNDYFLLNIINFFDEINPNNVYDKSRLQSFGKIRFVTASIAISNYTIVPIEKFNKI